MKCTIDRDGALAPLALGMDAGEVFARMQGRPEAFRRTQATVEPTYAFADDGLHFDTDADGRIRLVAIFRPNACHVAGVPVLGRPLDDVVADLARAGIDAQRVDVGAQCRLAGACLLFVEVEAVVDCVEVERVLDPPVTPRAG